MARPICRSAHRPPARQSGKVIGFVGRLIDDRRKAPKYINSPQTLLYNKSQHIFGYSQAKSEIGRAGYTVVVEGNLDVLTAHQAGYQTVVATAGTALTADHFKVLSRLASEVRLAFDGDRAGLKATERAISLAAQTSASLMVIPLPAGQDPDDLIRQSPSQWRQLYESPQAALDWLYDQYREKLDLNTAAGKRRLTDAMLAVIGHLNDPVEVDHYLAKLTEIGSSREAIDSKYKDIRERIKTERERSRAIRRVAASPSGRLPPPRPARHLIRLLVHPPTPSKSAVAVTNRRLGNYWDCWWPIRIWCVNLISISSICWVRFCPATCLMAIV